MVPIHGGLALFATAGPPSGNRTSSVSMPDGSVSIAAREFVKYSVGRPPHRSGLDGRAGLFGARSKPEA